MAVKGGRAVPEVGEQVKAAATELIKLAGVGPGQLLVIGCSTSEVLGRRIGTAGSLQLAAEIMAAVQAAAAERGVALAIQCCEHLNRALVLPRAVAEQQRLPVVSAWPVPKAGGALAAVAMDALPDPVLVESIQADAGLDIGHTLIGMHLRPVVVPVRLSVERIGQAPLVAARTRPKLIGGERAVYRREGTP
jgi:uncharacterized protein (TIGR01440 family)